MSEVDVTVALLTCHQPRMFADALASLDQMTTSDEFTFEILVVDNASQPETRAYVTEFAGRARHPVRLVCEETPGLSSARNRAIREARAAWIVFFDDDQLAAPEWLLEMYRLAREKRSRIVGGTMRLKLPAGCQRELGPVCRNLLGEFSPSDEPIRYSRKLTPGFGHVLVHGSVFEEVGPFDVRLLAGGEDSELYNRTREAGIESWYCPSAVAYHVIPEHRLKEEYMRWTALRQGVFLPRRERAVLGAMYPACFAARVAQMCLAHVPRLAWHWLSQNGDLVLDARCRLWRAEGYFRQALHDALPQYFGQQDFFSSLNFREGRQRLASAHG